MGPWANCKHNAVQHARGTEEPEFSHIASLFGIQGTHPDRNKFVHPHSCHTKKEIKESKVYQALHRSIIEVIEAEQRREQGKAPGSKQPWKLVCQEMRENALRILRHSRKQIKARQKKKLSKAGNQTIQS